jgi:hypothetical protein
MKQRGLAHAPAGIDRFRCSSCGVRHGDVAMARLSQTPFAWTRND